MKTITFLTFVGDQCGKATEALNLYTALFPGSKIDKVTHYQEGEPGGTPELIKYGEFTLNGTTYGVSESNYAHKWSFTPGVSLLVTDTSAARISTLFESLSANGGQIMVPLDNYQGERDYGFGEKFGWCEDPYGISWQFILNP